MESIAKIFVWAHKEHGIPLQMCPDSKPGSKGFGYHRQGIDGNFGPFKFPGRVQGGEIWSSSFGKVCPGDRRIGQMPEILERARDLATPRVKAWCYVIGKDRQRKVVSPFFRRKARLRLWAIGPRGMRKKLWSPGLDDWWSKPVQRKVPKDKVR